jgi:branched-chain amino acid transport system ATP-binding protein
MTLRLELQGVTVAYARTPVVHGLDLRVNPGEIVALLGANGAGKTSTLRAISQQRVTTTGSIRFEGRELRGMTTAAIAALGVAHVPEGRGTFGDLSVTDNLRVGAILRRDQKAIQQDLQRMQTLFPKLASRASQPAGTLSGGEQQMLAIARALMMRPRLLLLDEPSFGIAPRVTQEIYALLATLARTEGLTALIVEQNAELALALAHRAYVLESGRMRVEGTSSELRDNPVMRQSYLGH